MIPASTLDFYCPVEYACGNWQAGDYDFTAIVNGSAHHVTATFQTRRSSEFWQCRCGQEYLDRHRRAAASE